MMIDILLATYNGAAFLAEQLDSLLGQTHQDWRVIARDDGSKDTTVAILEDYAAKYPGRFTIVRDEGHGGAMASFSRLMTYAQAPYMAFCDQDDFWLPEKLEILLKALQQAESEFGSNTPLLIHSDLEVVDEKLGLINPSFWTYQGIDPSRDKFSHLLVQNTVTGCGMLFNRALLQYALPIPDSAVMHDHWLALIASAAGKILVEPRALIRYRQHGRNALGAIKMPSLFALPKRSLTRGNWVLRYDVPCKQAEAVVDALSGRVPSDRLLCAKRFARLHQHSWLGRRMVLLQHDLLPANWRRKLSVLLRI